MNQGRPLLIPSQQWWEGSDGHARITEAPRIGNGDDASAPPVPVAVEARPAEAHPAWDFSSAPLVPVAAAPAQPVPETARPAVPDTASFPEAPAAATVRRPDPVLVRRAAVTLCILLVVCLSGLGISKWWTAHAFASARSACESAELEVGSSRRRLARAMSSVEGMDMGASSVADPKTLDELNAAAKAAKTAIPPVSCRASAQSSQTLESETARAEGATRHTDEAAARVEKAVAAVKASQKEKRVIDAQTGLKDRHGAAGRLYKDSDGKVADNATREALQRAVDQAGRLLKSTDTARIGKASADLQSASDAVRASMDAKSRQDAEAAASQAVQEAPAPTPGAGVQAVPAPQTPVRPLPQRQPAPQPQSPPRRNGWSVPAPTGPDTGLPGHISGL